jgi:hypothetical protein
MELGTSGDGRDLVKILLVKATPDNSPPRAAVEEKEMITPEKSDGETPPKAAAPAPAPAAPAEVIKIPESDSEYEPRSNSQKTFTITSGGQDLFPAKEPQTQRGEVMVIDEYNSDAD